MQAVIMAGGKGTRLASITKNEVPKPMVQIKGRPLLEWQLDQLKRYGITRVTMIIGFLGEKITEYFGDGSRFGFEIDYIVEEEPLGTAGAFYYLKEKLVDREFLLVFGDVFFDINIRRMIDFHHEKHAMVTLFAHPNSHPFDSDLIVAGEDKKVVGFDSKHNVRDYYYDNQVNAGFYVVNSTLCDIVTAPVKTDFEKDILAVMVERGEDVYAYISPEFIKDVGTVERIQKTVEDFDSGFIQRRNLEYRQKAIFLDRDGTLNELNGFIKNPDEFTLLPTAIPAIQKINSSGFLAIVLTNQPVIARGEASAKDIENVHKKMKTLLGKEGAYIDDIFYCPHHPDKGFEGEVASLKIDCECRKPKTGMVNEAVLKYNLDLNHCYMVGDMTMDLEMGRNAGIATVLVKTGMAGEDQKYSRECDIVADNVLTAVEEIIKRESANE